MRQALSRLADLTPRERDVLQGLLAGRINKTSAHDRAISRRTVEVYRTKLMATTSVRSMPEQPPRPISVARYARSSNAIHA